MISGLDTSVEYEFATFAKNYYGNSKWSEYNSTFPGADVITRTYDNDIDNDIDDDIIDDDDCKSMIMIFFYENYVFFFTQPRPVAKNCNSKVFGDCNVSNFKEISFFKEVLL